MPNGGRKWCRSHIEASIRSKSMQFGDGDLKDRRHTHTNTRQSKGNVEETRTMWMMLRQFYPNDIYMWNVIQLDAIIVTIKMASYKKNALVNRHDSVEWNSVI